MAFTFTPQVIAAAAPTVNDDNTKGYLPGYWWFDTNGNIAYWCESNATGAAVWHGGTGVTAHTGLTALSWTTAGHTMTAGLSQTAGFASAGTANLQRLISNPTRRATVWWQVRTGQTSYDQVGCAAGSASGAVAGVNNKPIAEWTGSVATAGQRFGRFLVTVGQTYARLSDGIESEVVITTGSDISSLRIWILFSDTAPASGNGDTLGTAGINSVGLRYSTVAGDTNWMAYTSNAASQTATSTGVAVATSTTYGITIRASASALNVSVNGSAETSVATTLPASSVYMGHAFVGILIANSNRVMGIGNFYADVGAQGTWP